MFITSECTDIVGPSRNAKGQYISVQRMQYRSISVTILVSTQSWSYAVLAKLFVYMPMYTYLFRLLPAWQLQHSTQTVSIPSAPARYPNSEDAGVHYFKQKVPWLPTSIVYAPMLFLATWLSALSMRKPV